MLSIFDKGKHYFLNNQLQPSELMAVKMRNKISCCILPIYEAQIKDSE